MKDPWKTCIGFSKKERAGILVLLTLLIGLLIFPWVLKDASAKADTSLLDQLHHQLTGLQLPKPAVASWAHYTDSSQATPYKYANRSVPVPGELFEFDPNTISEKDWRRLGLSERNIQTIVKYRNKGGRFRKPEDLGKIYSLGPDVADRLIPYVRIEPSHHPSDATKSLWHSTGRRDSIQQAGDNHSFGGQRSKKRSPSLQPIDINRSDTTAWIALPGIGSKLAQRIISFREKLGGFYTVAQVRETYGLPDSTFQQIRSLLHCTEPALRTININQADAPTLKQHPYIRWNMANAIIRYREQHGPFKTVDDLERIVLITTEIRQRILPYLRTRE